MRCHHCNKAVCEFCALLAIPRSTGSGITAKWNTIYSYRVALPGTETHIV